MKKQLIKQCTAKYTPNMLVSMCQNYPGQFVLMTPVEATPEETYHILSPGLTLEEVSDALLCYCICF